MRYARTVGALFLFFWLSGAPRAARAEAVRYQIDSTASRVLIHVGKAGLLSFAGHEHEVVAPKIHGSVAADPDQPAQASVDVTFDASALRVTGAGEPAQDVAEVQKTMLGPECLDVERFPTIRFVSTSVAPAGEEAGTRRLAIHGSLTLHGVTRPVTLNARVDFESDSIEASGVLAVRQTDFGIKPISKAGVVNVKDELDIKWRLVGRRP